MALQDALDFMKKRQEQNRPIDKTFRVLYRDAPREDPPTQLRHDPPDRIPVKPDDKLPTVRRPTPGRNGPSI